jgi:L-fuconolactonase
VTARSRDRVDAHHHLWDLDRRPQPWTEGLPALQRSFGFRELEPQLDAAGVAGTVLVHTVGVLAETHELLQLAHAEPRVLGVVGWFDLTGAALSEELDEARALPGGERLVGVRHQLQTEPDPDWLARPDVRRALRRLGEVGLAYDVVASPEALPDVPAAVDSAPGTTFVLDHAGKPGLASGDLLGWRRDIAELARREHVAVKLSGLVTEADWATWAVDDLRPAVDTVLETFGPHRTMWGSDWPVSLLAGADYATWVEVSEELLTGLSEEESAAVWSGTARATYMMGR